MAPDLPRRLLLTALPLLLAAAPAKPPADPPPEPPGLWSGPMEGPVPEDITGGIAIPDIRAAQYFMARRHPVLIDVSPAPIKPLVTNPAMPWLPPAHQDLPGSTWLPNAGREVLKPARAKAFVAAVDKLTLGNHKQFLMVYCHPNCWGSYNAARTLITAGYRHVGWFPPGIETWSTAGLPLQRTDAVVY
jgi:PQQ-dependent catabolism-associated CXXCW motif protein